MRTCCRLCMHFRDGDFDLSNRPRCRRPHSFDTSDLGNILPQSKSQTTKEIGQQLRTFHVIVANRLKIMEKVNKLLTVVPHDLNADSYL